MTARSIRDVLAEQPVLQALEPSDLDLLAGCGTNEVFAAGALLAREGEAADRFWVVRSGRAAIELHAPGGPLVIETLGAGELIGWSWVVPPYRWSSDVEALEELHVIGLDGACLRAKCEADPAFGYRVMQRLTGVAAERLHATQVRLLDLFGGRARG
jgi:CRP-like cAMP-binding protein